MAGGYFTTARDDMTRWTQDQVDAHQRKLKQCDVVTSNGRSYMLASKLNKRAKFRNIRCQSADGKNFASRLERDYYEQLLVRWKAGDVLWYIRQPRFDLEGGVEYRADFLEVSARGVEVIDTKGCPIRESLNKIKQVEARYGIKVKLVRSV